MKNICEMYDKEFSNLPEKVLQFGEGNFLRAFADYYIQKADGQGVFCGSVVIAQPTPHGRADFINSQNSQYTVAVRGRENGAVVEEFHRISCISRCINTFEDYSSLVDVAVSDDLQVVISNTTEAGIEFNENDRLADVPYVTYPGKLTALLYERFKARRGGLLILPVELIENNGRVLKKCVLDYARLWRLGEPFEEYIENDCHFCSTLVDRIVTGFPKQDYAALTQRLGYEDKLLTVCEPYNCWIIEGREEWEELFPLARAGLNIKWCSDLSLYRERKVRILNGAHTASVAAAYLSGFDIVRDMTHDAVFEAYIKKLIFEEVIPALDFDKKELTEFAQSVLDRFDNPFIDHRLLDISLNSVSKFRARCLPTLKDYYAKFSKLPSVICFALAALITFFNGRYEDGAFVGRRGGEPYVIKEPKEVTDFFEYAYSCGDTVKAVLESTLLWGEALTEIGGLYEAVKKYYESIAALGMKAAAKRMLDNE